jgi:anaerobic selenocysteine-containing dehydrogenase
MLFGRGKKNPIHLHDKGVQEWKYATCGYCSVGCSIEVGVDKNGVPVTTRGVGDADVNRGKLCIKGLTEAQIFKASGRGTDPLIRNKIFEPWQTTIGIQPSIKPPPNLNAYKSNTVAMRWR